MGIGQNIASLRKEQGMLQDELAKKASISRGYLARIETEHSKASHKTIARIADGLGVSIEQLYKSID